ncbi:hypothetical protein EX30DRAFT_370338 [Ascodesmis nigricans]|uniref:AAA+ ATPase domain-containing protein n=1 Tax=Ascodesmis nigricans TaxID=341454 RepID=A0A4S2N307_9PEZI|nr:hypothetical protein EX30DRAFT_370338 [Ascodesmis nigricans]
MADSPSNSSLRSEPSPVPHPETTVNGETSPSSTSNTSSSTAGTSGGENSTDKPQDVKNEDATNTANGEVATATNGSTSPVKKRYCTHKKQAMMEAEKEAKEKAEKEKPEKEKIEAEKKKKEDDKDKKESDGEKDKKENEDAEKGKDEDEKETKKKKNKKSSKKKKKRKAKESDAESDSSSSSSPSSSSSSSDSSDSSDESDADAELLRAVLKVMLKSKAKARKAKKKRRAKKKAAKKAAEERESSEESTESSEEKKEDDKEKSENAALEFKRVDELYDKELHDWTIKDTVPNPKTDNYSDFVFTVRRCFDYEGRHTDTVLDIKSPLLKDALHGILGHIRGISLVEDVPIIDPRTIFIFEDQIKAWLEADNTDRKDKKPRRDPLTNQPLPDFTDDELKLQKQQVKLLIEYIDTDFRATKAQLYPLLENKSITYELLWAVLKPNTIMYTTCAGSNEPRAFRLEYAQENSSFTRGKWWSVEGRYLEFEGVHNTGEGPTSPHAGFGWGTIMVDIDSFKGPRKIQSLACYPMEMRKDREELNEKLIERGKKFVTLSGQQYKMHHGLAFLKKNRQYLKVHINGRIMIDSATFRRVNPNYVLSSVKARNNDAEDDEEANYFYLDPEDDPANDSACDDCCCNDESKAEEKSSKEVKKVRWIRDNEGEWQLVTKDDILAGQNKLDTNIETVENNSSDSCSDGPPRPPTFSDNDYLIAAPVVLGWAFNEKLWLEFPVSQISEIEWNEKAFDQLVLPKDQKDIVRALVESHSATEGSCTIDDVIAGKGRGLVSVLHGPPGVGKTMTCEAIAEFLRRPLYCVSSGELGTNPTQLEHELQKILDIAHGWGAVLLLDEADVFLEKRSFADMHRNALVGIFLRLLEYFQGILFLTTNRVETFDDAFQSRIHVALRYTDLKTSAKSAIWKMFIDKVHSTEVSAASEPSSPPTPPSPSMSATSLQTATVSDSSSKTITESFANPTSTAPSPATLPRLITSEDISYLAKKDLNGRQIKNIVRTAQALAKSQGERMGMRHVRKVLAVAEGFDDDLGGRSKISKLGVYA